MDGLFANDRDWARPGQSTRTMLLRYIADYLRFSAPRPHDHAVRSRIADLGDALAVRWRAMADGVGAQVLDKTVNEPFAVFNAAPAGA